MVNRKTTGPCNLLAGFACVVKTDVLAVAGTEILMFLVSTAAIKYSTRNYISVPEYEL